MSGKVLFTLPIGDDGSITVTEPAEAVYLLTFISQVDNRLRTPFCQAFTLALDILELEYQPGVVVTTSSSPKFFSNGLDLEHAASTPGFYNDSLFALYSRLASYPMPTVALVNGHAFAGGMMLALHHDYRVFNPKRGYLCMNEVEFGAPLKPAMLAVFEAKVSPKHYRNIILEAHRYNGPQALEAELVDKLGGLEQALELIEERKLVDKPRSGVYGVLKEQMYRKTLHDLATWDAQNDQEAEAKDEASAKAKKEARVAAWKSGGKAKL